MESITVIDARPVIRRKKRVAAYARVSTSHDEQMVSLEAQMEHYNSYIIGNPDYDYAGLYYDEGISGKNIEKRDALLRLLKDCEDHKIDRIITKSISRFSRNTVDCLEMVRKLSGLGISIYFEKENIDTEHMSSELVLTILSSIAESESKSISENEKWSVKRRFQNGTYVISTPPYGYSKKGKEMVINQAEAEVVRNVFEMSKNGYGAYAIAAKLNSANILPRRGAKWSETSVNDILVNPAYIGDACFQKTYTDDSFKRHDNHGECDMYYCSEHHEAIIDAETFQRTAELIELRRKEKRIEKGTSKYQKRYEMSGKIICGECGTRFKRKLHNMTANQYTAWVCDLHIKDRNKCSMKYIRDADVKSAVLRMMKKLHVSVSSVLKPFVESLRDAENNENFRQILKLENEIKNISEQKETLLNMMTLGYISPENYDSEINILSAESDILNEEKHRLSLSVTGNMVHLNEARKLLSFVKEEPEKYHERMFTEFIEDITVLSREKISLNLKCGLKLTERL